MANELAYIFVSNKKIWPSHEQVKKNLGEAYLRSKHVEAKKVQIKSDLDFKEKLLRVIKLSKKSTVPIHLVLLDIGLNLNLFASLAPFLDGKKFIIHLHIHGDLCFRAQEWINLINQLEGFKVSLRVCSAPMKKICRELFPKHQILVIPFPIKDEYFFVKKSHRELNTISYFGRITPDKGVLELLQWWLTTKPSQELHLYGTWDENTHLSWEDRSEFEGKAQQIKNLIATNSAIKMRWLKTEKSLLNAMDKSDLIVSFSRFKCEEYGLALREALARGKAIVASRWGGHQDLRGIPQVKLLKVNNDRYLELEAFNPSLTFRQLQQKKSSPKNLFSIQSVSKTLSLSWRLARRSPRVIPPRLSMNELVMKYFR